VSLFLSRVDFFDGQLAKTLKSVEIVSDVLELASGKCLLYFGDDELSVVYVVLTAAVAVAVVMQL
jgi:hypothetical protein